MFPVVEVGPDDDVARVVAGDVGALVGLPVLGVVVAEEARLAVRALPVLAVAVAVHVERLTGEGRTSSVAKA